MPFTLAHPAAVLPLKRYCPRPLNFAALIVGSVVPDAGYLFARWNLDEVAHRFTGGFLFCLPAGLLILLCVYKWRGAVANLLPARARRLLLPSRWQPPAPFFVLVISLLLGIWTHQFWDAFTHSHGWLANHWPVLKILVGNFLGHRVEISHLILYASTLAGVAYISFVYQRCLHAANGTANPAPSATCWLNAIIAGILVVPIEAIHHLMHGLPGIAAVTVCTFALLLGMAWKISCDISALEKSRTTVS